MILDSNGHTLSTKVDDDHAIKKIARVILKVTRRHKFVVLFAIYVILSVIYTTVLLSLSFINLFN